MAPPSENKFPKCSINFSKQHIHSDPGTIWLDVKYKRFTVGNVFMIMPLCLTSFYTAPLAPVWCGKKPSLAHDTEEWHKERSPYLLSQIWKDTARKKETVLFEWKRDSAMEMVRGPIWDPEKEPRRTPAVGVNHWWETRPRSTHPVHVWLSHWGNRHCIGEKWAIFRLSHSFNPSYKQTGHASNRHSRDPIAYRAALESRQLCCNKTTKRCQVKELQLGLTYITTYSIYFGHFWSVQNVRILIHP